MCDVHRCPSRTPSPIMPLAQAGQWVASRVATSAAAVPVPAGSAFLAVQHPRLAAFLADGAASCLALPSALSLGLPCTLSLGPFRTLAPPSYDRVRLTYPPTVKPRVRRA